MKNLVLSFLLILYSINIIAQNNSEIHGDFNLNLQSYVEDATINALAADEVVLNNAYLNLIYSNNNFTAGLR